MIKLLFKLAVLAAVIFAGWWGWQRFTAGGDDSNAGSALCEQVLGEGENSDKCQNFLEELGEAGKDKLCAAFEDGSIADQGHRWARDWVANKFKNDAKAQLSRDLLDAYYRYRHTSLCG